MKAIRVTLDGEQFFNAFTYGETWNGFECPYFTAEEGEKVVQHVVEGLTYSKEMNVFIEYDVCDICNTDSYNVIQGIRTEHGELFSIGNGGWTWEQQ